MIDDNLGLDPVHTIVVLGFEATVQSNKHTDEYSCFASLASQGGVRQRGGVTPGRKQRSGSGERGDNT